MLKKTTKYIWVVCHEQQPKLLNLKTTIQLVEED